MAVRRKVWLGEEFPAEKLRTQRFLAHQRGMGIVDLGGMTICPRVGLLHQDDERRHELVRALGCRRTGFDLVVFRSSPGVAQVIRAASPQVVVIGASGPSSLEVCAACTAAGMRVILVDVRRGGRRAANALRAGARGVLFTGAPASEVLRAVSFVRRGDLWAPRRTLVAALGSSADVQRSMRAPVTSGVMERERDPIVAGLSAAFPGGAHRAGAAS